MTYHGKVHNGAIVLDPGVELPEGVEVRVELDLPASLGTEPGADPLLRMIDLAVETGIPDLATQGLRTLDGEPLPPWFGVLGKYGRPEKPADMEAIRRSIATGIASRQPSPGSSTG
jgi:hypothetical protein